MSEVSERANDGAQRRARAKRAVRSKRTSERCERMSEWTSEWPSTPICILGCFRPQWDRHTHVRSHKCILAGTPAPLTHICSHIDSFFMAITNYKSLFVCLFLQQSFHTPVSLSNIHPKMFLFYFCFQWRFPRLASRNDFGRRRILFSLQYYNSIVTSSLVRRFLLQVRVVQLVYYGVKEMDWWLSSPLFGVEWAPECITNSIQCLHALKDLWQLDL